MLVVGESRRLFVTGPAADGVVHGKGGVKKNHSAEIETFSGDPVLALRVDNRREMGGCDKAPETFDGLL